MNLAPLQDNMPVSGGDAIAKPGRATPDSGTRLGIVAGGGSLPLAVAKGAASAGHAPFILGLQGNADAQIEQFPHAYAQIGQVGRILQVLRREGCHDLVFVGSIRRPNLLKIKVDLGFFRHSPSLIRLMKGGDDTVLRGVAKFFETQGFEVHAAHVFAPGLLAPAGVFSRAVPDAQTMDDIAHGFRVVQALGALDIGQAAVVAHGYVLGVEAAEGTDALLRRCAELNRWGRGGRKGVLVKAPKPSQDRRLDLPTIGPRTVELVGEANLAGIAVIAQNVLIAEQEQLVDKADTLGLFLYGVPEVDTSIG